MGVGGLQRGQQLARSGEWAKMIDILQRVIIGDAEIFPELDEQTLRLLHRTVAGVSDDYAALRDVSDDASALATRSAQSSELNASGFSHTTCLPASIAWL